MRKSNYLFIGLILCLSIYVIPRALRLKSNKADLIIYSFDRPLQLYALLESVEDYLTNLGTTQVIYRYSSGEFERGYEEIKKQFEWATFTAQSPVTPHQDFRPLTMNALQEGPNRHVLFAVDDIIVTDVVDIAACIDALEKHNAYGFYLRLGKNITYSYLNKKKVVPPHLKQVEPTIYSWRLGDGAYDWGWPHSLDMVIYRKKEIISMFEQLDFNHFKTPNLLEGFCDHRFKVPNRIGLCFDSSKMVNIPVNLVQEIWKTRHMNTFSTAELLKLFNEHKKIDITQLYQYKNHSVHEEIPFSFIDRT